MTQATNYFPSQNVEVFYQKESTVGDQPNDTGLNKQHHLVYLKQVCL